MKVKELKAILKDWDDETEIWVTRRDEDGDLDFHLLVKEIEFHFPDKKKNVSELVLLIE